MKRKLKVAIFHLAFVYSGGGEKLVLEEARGLAKLGYDVSVFASVVKKRHCFPDLISGVKIQTFLPEIPHFLPEWESFQILLVCLLAPFLAVKFRKFDVIFAANQPSPWIAFWIKKFFKVPYVTYLAQPTRFLHLRKVDVEDGLVFVDKPRFSLATLLLKSVRPLCSRLDQISIRSSGVVLANGSYITHVIEKVYNIQAISCPAGALPSKRSASYKSRMEGKLRLGKKMISKPYILITNRHFPQKRFEYAIMVLVSLLQFNSKVKLVITGGETDYTKDLKDLIRHLSLEDKVIFLGLIPENDLRRLYTNAGVYIYTAPQEDFGMGIIEAMATGTPVVAWNNGGPTGIIEDGETGFLAEPYNLIDFSQKVVKLFSERSMSEKMGKAAVRSVRKRFTYKIHIQEIEKAFEKVNS